LKVVFVAQKREKDLCPGLPFGFLKGQRQIIQIWLFILFAIKNVFAILPFFNVEENSVI